MLLALVLAAALAAPAPAPGQPSVSLGVATRVRVPARLTVGDRFQVTLVVTTPKRSLVTGPLADTMGVFVVASEKRKTASRSDTDVTTYDLSVAGFRAGRHRFPPLRFLVHSGDRSDTLQSDTASVTIMSVLPPKMADIHGLAPHETFPNRLLWITPGAILLLLGLAWLARRLLRRWREIRAEAAAPLPPWEEALAALDAMPWREWLAGGQAQRYYYALSEVLKRYIERRFEFGAVEQTSSEMLAAMRVHRTPLRDEVSRFITRADLVKYAKWMPPADEAESAIEQVRDIVQRTRPVETATQGPTGPANPQGPTGGTLAAEGSA